MATFFFVHGKIIENGLGPDFDELKQCKKKKCCHCVDKSFTLLLLRFNTSHQIIRVFIVL